MKQIGNSNEDMLALLEAVVGIKNELLYIREYFHPLLKGEMSLCQANRFARDATHSANEHCNSTGMTD